jgi:hypothetical protein
MEELKAKAENLTNHLGDLLNTYYELTVVTVAQKATRAAAGGFTFLVIVIFSLCALLFLGVGLAIWLGGLLNSPAAGYFIVAGSYILLVIIFYALRKKIILPFIRDLIVKKMYE